MSVGKEETLPGSPRGSQEWRELTELNPWHLSQQMQRSPLPPEPETQPGENYKAAEPTQDLPLRLWLGASQVAISDTQAESWACNLQPLSTPKHGAAGTWGSFLNTREALGGGPDGGRSPWSIRSVSPLGSGVPGLLWLGQASGSGGQPPSHWPEATRGTRPGAGQGGQLVTGGMLRASVDMKLNGPQNTLTSSSPSTLIWSFGVGVTVILVPIGHVRKLRLREERVRRVSAN